MLSESARMSSATETRFRIQAENSKPRAVKVIALDTLSESVVRRLASSCSSHAAFFTASSFADLITEVDAADLVVMVATPSGHAHGASMIGEACSLKGVITTALIVGAASASDEALSKTLAQLRPWSSMVVIAEGDDYVDDLLNALRA